MPRLFISHSWTYSERYLAMIALLNSRTNFVWHNYSVPVDAAFVGMNNTQLAEQLKRQIRPVNCVIILAGMWTNHSDWIISEMNFAKEIGKPILAVRPRSAKVMPTAVVALADKVVNWNGDSIISGIGEIS